MIIATEKSPSGVKMEFSIPETDNKVVYFNYKYYVVNWKGKTISKKYDEIHKFVNGLAVVKLGEKKGVININGKEIIKPQYDNAHVDKYAIRICLGDKWGIADYEGKTIRKPFCFFIEAFNEPISRFEDDKYKWGVITSKGRAIIKPSYMYLGELTKKPIIAMKHLKYGGIDLHEKILIPFDYKHMTRNEDESTILFNHAQDKIIV